MTETGKYKPKFKRIPLSQGKFALVDAADFIWLKRWKWFFDTSKKSKTGYAVTNGSYVNGKRLPKIRMHNMILGEPADHKNGNGLNNRRKNLRPANKYQQAQNKGICAHKKSKGCKGVSIVKDRNGVPAYWIARITVMGKRKYLGVFKNHVAASRAYIKAAKELHGEYARWK